MEEKNTRLKILKVATKLFAEYGFEGTSTRDICKAANINISLISYYFGGKEKLYDEIISDSVRKQNEFMERFIDINADISVLSFSEKINLLKLTLEKVIDYIFNEISRESLIIFLRRHQKTSHSQRFPLDDFLHKLVGAILNKDKYSQDVVYAVLFLMSQIVFPFLVENSLLHLLQADSMNKIDTQKIKKHINNYIDQFFLNIN